ncbi:MAG: RHS repeat-associated core domain-containing protein, partial [Chlamydiota bacterium]|nr:RHS repeat-associated core domain-containing protein [Chlamydiota bacterium]
TVTLESKLGRIKSYEVENQPGDITKRLQIDASQNQTQTIKNPDSTTTTTFSDGTMITTQQAGDPRFGLQAPYASKTTITTPQEIIYQQTANKIAEYEPGNLLGLINKTETITTNNKTTQTVYTAANQTFVTTTPENRTITQKINDVGQIVETSIPQIKKSNFDYDPKGRLQTIWQGTNEREYTLTYDKQGYLDTITNPMNHTVSFDYDNAGRVTTQTLPNNQTIQYNYDANGNLTGITPPGKTIHEFAYNEIDLLNNYVPPIIPGILPDAESVQTQYVYNNDHQVDEINRPDGAVIDFIYDMGGRLQSITAPNTSTSYEYDSSTGNLATITGTANNTIDYTYDGSLLLSTTWDGEITGTVSRAYNNDFQIISHTINNGTPITYAYDNDGFLKQAGSLVLTRDSQNGFLKKTTLDNITIDFTYNTFGELQSDQAKFNTLSLYGVAYTRDDLGRITAKTETVEGAINTYAYHYDSNGRLDEVKTNVLITSEYNYDENGNRLNVTYTNPNDSSTETYEGSYDAQDRLTTYGIYQYSYNANGDLIKKEYQPARNPRGTGKTLYEYDVLGNLKSVTLPNMTQIEYVIDGNNRRIGKKVDGVLTQGFLYKDQLNPIAEVDGNGNVLSIFVYGSKSNIPDYLIKNDTTYRIISDHLGSPQLVVSTTDGSIIQKMEYDEFGRVIVDTNPGFQPFGFAGGIYDIHTKLVRFGARDYDPEIGRWTSKDPILFNGGDTNLYGYVLGDPVNLVDPTGNVGCSGPQCAYYNEKLLDLTQTCNQEVNSAWGKDLDDILEIEKKYGGGNASSQIYHCVKEKGPTVRKKAMEACGKLPYEIVPYKKLPLIPIPRQ